MNKKNLTQRSFMLVAAMLVAMNSWAGVKQAYAVYQSFTHTLVFYYDDQKDQKDGWVLNVYTGRQPDWYGSNLMEDVQSVTIDKSFADYKPKNGSYLFSFLRGVTWFNGLENLDTREMTNMEKMFYECGKESAYLNLDLRTFDTRKVTKMKDMFYSCKHLETVDLSSFDTQHVTDMSGMFTSCNDVTTIYASNLWTTVSLSPAQQQMFGNNHQLVGGAGTTYDGSYVESDYARIDQGTSAPGYFTYKTSTYNLSVRDIQVKIDNKADILGDGTVSFDAETNTLTLDNADITNTGNEGYGICNYYGNRPLTYDFDVAHLTINVLSDSKIATQDACLYINRADLTITGPGKLRLTSANADAIDAVICGLTLQDADVYAKGYGSAIKGTGSEMTVDHSYVDALSAMASMPTIYDFNAFLLVNSAFIDVSNGYSTFYSYNFYYDDGTCETRYDGEFDDDGVAVYYNDAYRWEVLIAPTGAVTAIDSPEIQDIEASSRPAYNLSGQRIAEGYRGIVVSNGKKYMRK